MKYCTLYGSVQYITQFFFAFHLFRAISACFCNVNDNFKLLNMFQVIPIHVVQFYIFQKCLYISV